jgi:hypothetical protein
MAIVEFKIRLANTDPSEEIGRESQRNKLNCFSAKRLLRIGGKTSRKTVQDARSPCVPIAIMGCCGISWIR